MPNKTKCKSSRLESRTTNLSFVLAMEPGSGTPDAKTSTASLAHSLFSIYSGAWPAPVMYPRFYGERRTTAPLDRHPVSHRLLHSSLVISHPLFSASPLSVEKQEAAQQPLALRPERRSSCSMGLRKRATVWDWRRRGQRSLLEQEGD